MVKQEQVVRPVILRAYNVKVSERRKQKRAKCSKKKTATLFMWNHTTDLSFKAIIAALGKWCITGDDCVFYVQYISLLISVQPVIV